MSSRPNDQSSERSTSDILEETIDAIQSMVRAELNLARTEMTGNVKSAGIGGGFIAAGALLGIFAFSLLLETIVEILEEIMPEWLATLLMAMILAAVGATLAMTGRDRIREADVVPREAIDVLRENTERA